MLVQYKAYLTGAESFVIWLQFHLVPCSLETINNAPLLSLKHTALSPLTPFLHPLQSIRLSQFSSASYSYPFCTTQNSFLNFPLTPDLGDPCFSMYPCVPRSPFKVAATTDKLIFIEHLLCILNKH